MDGEVVKRVWEDVSWRARESCAIAVMQKKDAKIKCDGWSTIPLK